MEWTTHTTGTRVRGIRFPSNNTIEYIFTFKVTKNVRGYIRAALEVVTDWYNAEKEEMFPGAPQLTIVAVVEMDNYGHNVIMRTLHGEGGVRVQHAVYNPTQDEGTTDWGGLGSASGSGCSANEDQSSLQVGSDAAVCCHMDLMASNYTPADLESLTSCRTRGL